MRLTLALSLAAVLLALPLFTQAYVLAGARPVRASQPAATRPRRAPDASEASSSVSVARDEDGAAGAAGATPGGVESDLQRLFMTADNPSVRESRIAGVVIKDVKEEDVEEKSELTKLNRKMRLEANRLRPVSEEYPDEDAEKQRKRLVRKAVVEILNLQAVKDWKTEQKTIQEVETKKLQGPDGLKSLGWKGNDRLKIAEKEAKRQMDPSKNNRPERRRDATDEVIKRWGVIQADDKELHRLTTGCKQWRDNVLGKKIRASITRCARRCEREEAVNFARAANLPGPLSTDNIGRMAVEEEPGSRPKGKFGLEKLATGVQKLKDRKLARLAAIRGGGGLALRGGGDDDEEAEGGDWKKFLPSAYPSTVHWLVAMIRLCVNQVMTRLGMIKPPSALAALAADPSISPDILKALENTKFKEEILTGLKNKLVTIVTNNVIFTEEDIVKAYETGEPPSFIPGSLTPLLKLATVADVHLLTQFPHCGIQDLNKYFENHSVPSNLNVHGVWVDDRAEGAVNKALNESGVFISGIDPHKSLFCETTDGRGMVSRVIGEMSTQGLVALHVDDSPQAVQWLQNVCRNTTVVGVSTDANQGTFAEAKKDVSAAAAPVIVLPSLAAYLVADA